MSIELSFIEINNKKVIKFTDVEFQYDIILRRIILWVSIEFDIFEVHQRMEFEEADFLYLRDGLEKIINQENKRMLFKPMIDQRLSLEFCFNDNKNVELKGVIFNSMFTGELKFRFEIRIVQVQSLINDLDNLIIIGRKKATN